MLHFVFSRLKKKINKEMSLGRKVAEGHLSKGQETHAITKQASNEKSKQESYI